jgi:hypothetical protein
MVGWPSARVIVQVMNFVGPICGLSEDMIWRCGGVPMNATGYSVPGPAAIERLSRPRRRARFDTFQYRASDCLSVQSRSG